MTAGLEQKSPGKQSNDARPFLRRRGADLAANIAIIAALWFAYNAVRGVTADHVSSAMQNAADLIRFQTLVGLPSEMNFQQYLIERTHLLSGANVYYMTIHFPATLLFLGWVWLRHHERFARIRNTLIGVTAMGMVLHVVYPLAPPRMINGFVDTAAVIGPNPYNMKISEAGNQIAAMPSLHVGWALLVALGIIWILDSKWRYLAALHPIATAGVVVITANHYWTDAIVAGVLVAIGWVIFQTRPNGEFVADPNRTLTHER